MWVCESQNFIGGKYNLPDKTGSLKLHRDCVIPYAMKCGF